MIFFKEFQIVTKQSRLQMENSGQIFSLWVGNNSQQLAHHFYALQAQQFFDESQDPIEQSCIWKLYDKIGQKKRPHFLTFDTQIPHLNYLRKVNNSKIIAQIQKNQAKYQSKHFLMQYKKKEIKEEFQQQDEFLYKHWEAGQSNYEIVEKNFIQDCDYFQYWKQTFKNDHETYEDKVRKHLENFDFLKSITFTSDLQKSGFSQELLFYLKDQCQKKNLYFFQLQTKIKGGFYQANQLESFAEIASLSDTFVKFKAQIPQFTYFDSKDPFIHLAPIMNCFITPLCLKDTSKSSYLDSLLVNPRRNIFDFAYTLPLIDKDLNLQKTTNIFDYLLQNKHKKFFNDQQLLKADLDFNCSDKQKQQINYLLQNNNQNKINYGADYIGLRTGVRQKSNGDILQHSYSQLISEAYVLKGHFKNFEKIFSPNFELLDLKYLEGILCNQVQNRLKYAKPYVKTYGEFVVNYPFHLVMFQHKRFGKYLRNVGTYKNLKINNELEEEWKQNLMQQADYYEELKNQEDD